jgi:TonB family protein
VRARLAARAPLAYPFGAEDLEADVVLELVVGTLGNVESATVTRGAGHGFDEAALAAVRNYRFTPAERTGTRVRVRMPWVVQFRLAR